MLVSRILHLKGFLTAVALASMLFTIMPRAEAGFMDFFDKILGRADQAVSEGGNSQMMPILSAPLNSNPLAGIGGGDIVIVQSSALLPVTGPLGSIADVVERRSDTISLYSVREGDSLSGIAKLFNVSVNTILWANDLKRGSFITPGQILVILPVSGIEYAAKKGDTVKAIAKKFNADEDEIIAFNDLPSGGALEIGMNIIIPNGEAPTIQSSGSIASRPSSGSSPSYQGYYLRPIIGGRKTQGIHGYNGVDLANYCGSPVMASASGDIIIARESGWNGGYGNYVVISHPNGTQTLYSHMQSIIIGQGWHVVQGQILGYMGRTGLATGCHVHFEVRGARNPF